MSLSNPFKLKLSKKCCHFCGVSYQDENKKIGLFVVPKNKFSSWQSIIPELRQTSLLCEKHFDKSDVVKGFSDGKVFHPYQRWRLRPATVPKHFLDYLFNTKFSNETTIEEIPVPVKLVSSPNRLEQKDTSGDSDPMEHDIPPHMPIQIETTVEEEYNVNDSTTPVEVVVSSTSLDQQVSNDSEPLENEENLSPMCTMFEITSVDTVHFHGESGKHELDNPSNFKRANNNVITEHCLPFADQISQKITSNNISSLPQHSGVKVPTISHVIPHSESDFSLPSAVMKIIKTNGIYDVTTKNEILDAQIVSPVPTVSGKNRNQNDPIKTQTYCTCKKEIKRQCAPCQIRELKMLVKEKDQQIKIIRNYNVKATLDIGKLKCKLREQKKKLNTSSKRLARMRQNAMDVAVILSKLKDDDITLTASDLDEKMKHLTHGERVIINNFITKGKAKLQAESGEIMP